MRANRASRIFIDLSKLKHPYTGLATVCAGFLEALARQDCRGLSIDLLLPLSHIPRYRQLYGAKFRYLPYFPAYKLYFYRYSYALVHYPHQDFSIRFLPKSSPLLVCVHDLNFLVEKPAGKRQRYLAKLQNLLRRSQEISTISHATKEAMHANLPISQPVRVIYNGVQRLCATARAKDLPKAFILSIGVLYPKKRVEYLLRMLAHLPQQLHLIIIGSGQSRYQQMLAENIAKLGLQNRVELAGTVSDEVKADYLQHCYAYVSVSAAEGFNLPILEAFSYGKPVFLSQIAAHKEIGSSLAYYFATLDPLVMAENFSSCMQNESENLRAPRIAYSQQFSWDKYAQEYLAIYRAYAKQGWTENLNSG